MKKEIIKGYVLAASAGIAVALFLAVLLMYQLYQQSLRERLKSSLILFSTQFEMQTLREDELQERVDGISADLMEADQGLRFTVLDPNGLILAESDAQAGVLGDSRANRPEVLAAVQGKWGFDLRNSDTGPRRYLYAAYQFDTYIYRTALPADDYGDLMRLLFLGAILCLAAGIVTAVLLGRRMAADLSEPVTSLTRATEAIAEGNFDQRVGEYPAELGVLGRSFNTMAAHLSEATSDLKQHNDELHSIISGIQDGIIAVQGNNMHPFILTEQVVSMMGAYSSTYQSLDTYGSNYSKLSIIARKALEKQEPMTEIIELSHPREAMINVYAAPFGDVADRSCVIVLHDITRVTKLEQIRSEFVANVSHELKTPLTSIRGYIQLLKSAKRDEETRDFFYEIIEIETDRLMILISDLLDLSEIENRGRAGLEHATGLQSCLLYEVAVEVKEQIEPIALEREVKINIDIPWDLEVAADYKRIKQLLSNLVSNAVLYNQPGGSVWIRAAEERDMVSIRVRDNGIGIPEEHRERIFERFYRVSKDRSREIGGTGLGLSIVKHIVNLYDGSITIESEVGRGTIFHIRLPLPRHPYMKDDYEEDIADV